MTKQDIDSIASLLDKCPLTQESNVKAHWRDVQIKVLKEDWDTETARLRVSDEGKPCIYVYPVLAKMTPDYRAFCVLREFGDYLLTKTPEETELMWRQKLTLPTTEQIDAFQQRLNQGFKSYTEVVESLKSPIDRLIAAHLSNAMMANGQAFAGATNINLREWGPTSEFATLRRYYSLTPLTSAYCPRCVDKDFGSAFASCVVYDLKTVLHTQVKDALREIIKRIITAAV
jgi:hypothetical protein